MEFGTPLEKVVTALEGGECNHENCGSLVKCAVAELARDDEGQITGNMLYELRQASVLDPEKFCSDLQTLAKTPGGRHFLGVIFTLTNALLWMHLHPDQKLTDTG